MIQRIISALVGLLFLVAVFIFTSFLVALALTAGVLLFAWAWWRSRGRGGSVIKGEYRVVRDPNYHLPHDPGHR
jgi:hypothetical protein